jgi:hypothetical protein
LPFGAKVNVFSVVVPNNLLVLLYFQTPVTLWRSSASLGGWATSGAANAGCVTGADDVVSDCAFGGVVELSVPFFFPQPAHKTEAAIIPMMITFFIACSSMIEKCCSSMNYNMHLHLECLKNHVG